MKGEIDSFLPLTKDSLPVPSRKEPRDLRPGTEKGIFITGRVLDALTGEPVPGAVVVTDRFAYKRNFVPAAPSGEGFSRDHETVSDEEGRFELGKLPPGRYRVIVAFPEEDCRTEGETVLIDHPGLFVEDIHLGGGETRGVVADEISGKAPVPGKGGKAYLLARNLSLPGKRYTTFGPPPWL